MRSKLDEHAVQAIQLARQEAYDRRFSYVGTESLVVGLLREAQTRQVDAQDPWGLNLERVRAAVGRRVGSGTQPVGEPPCIPMTPRALEVLTQAEQQSRRLGSKHVAPEHILLGLFQVGEGEGLNALKEVGAPIDDLRRALEQSLQAGD
jgi:ATP-dependent Clp protease ATP-binding subunit ClpC